MENTIREQITLNSGEVQEIVFSENDDFDVIEHEVIGHWRHGTEETCVVKRLSDGKYFRIYYRDSVKESMEFKDMNSGGTFKQVFPVEKLVTIFT